MNDEKRIRPTSIGGQAVIEGVMMRGKNIYAMAIRKTDGSIAVKTNDVSSYSKRGNILKMPIVRGIMAFVDSLFMGMKIISESAEIAMDDIEEEGEPSKFEKFLKNIFGEKLNDIIMFLSVVLSIIFSVGLFILLPTFLTSKAIGGIIGGRTWILSISEGILRIAILVLYLFLISKAKDVQRLFQYHGAEHKTINCYESGDELTIENVMKHTRLHKRCGTSFLLFVMIISMIVFFFVRTDVIWQRFVFRILLVPFIAGLSYEVIRLAGKSDNFIVNLISKPGLWLQNITTNEPDESQVEIAIKAMEEVLKNEECVS